MDGVIAVGARPTMVTDLHAILEIAAIAHGERVHVHPLADGAPLTH